MTFSVPLGLLDYAIERGLQKRYLEIGITPSTTRLPPSNSWVPKKKVYLLEGGLNDSDFLLSHINTSHDLECEKVFTLKTYTLFIHLSHA